ncbi:reverse transcriptase domain-containing protein [Tanacetum coccineum]
MYNIQRSDPTYLKGVQDFLTFAANNRVNSGDAGIYCPCIDYKNFVRLKNIKDIEYHFITRGFVQKYTCWSRHSELLVDNSTSVRTSIDNENGDLCINDECENSNEMSDNVEDTTGVLRLFGVKAKYRWTDTSFTDLLEVVHEMLPNGSPKQLGNDIDVYLAPLIDDLKTLWDKGVKVYDAYKKENFTLRAMIFRTISDFPAYGNLSGYSTKGKFAFPVCEDQTSLRWLRNCKKSIFMRASKIACEKSPVP